MSNHVNHLLAQWLPLKDKHKWVLGFIFKTEGSCYRKAGAMMLFSDAGHLLGILSGGCLESDIVKKAQRVMTDGVSRTAVYDDEDEEDEIDALEGDEVEAFEDLSPSDTILGVDVFPVIHKKTKQKIFVSAEDIKELQLGDLL